MHGFQLWANLPSSPQDDRAALPGHPGGRHPRGRSTTTARACASSAAISGASAARSTASPPSRAISTSPCRRASASRFKVETYRQAFAYIFEGSGTFRDASEAVRRAGARRKSTARSLRCATWSATARWSSSARGDEVVVQAGDEGRALPARLRQADRGAGRLARADRDESRARISPGDRRPAQRHLHPRRRAGVTRPGRRRTPAFLASAACPAAQPDDQAHWKL